MVDSTITEVPKIQGKPGSRTLEAVEYVLDNPGCSKYAVARSVGPHGSSYYGGKTVGRALNRGLIKDKGKGWTYELYVTPDGLKALGRDD